MIVLCVFEAGALQMSGKQIQWCRMVIRMAGGCPSLLLRGGFFRCYVFLWVVEGLLGGGDDLVEVEEFLDTTG